MSSPATTGMCVCVWMCACVQHFVSFNFTFLFFNKFNFLYVYFDSYINSTLIFLFCFSEELQKKNGKYSDNPLVCTMMAFTTDISCLFTCMPSLGSPSLLNVCSPSPLFGFCTFPILSFLHFCFPSFPIPLFFILCLASV